MSSTTNIKNSSKPFKLRWRTVGVIFGALLIVWILFDLLIGGNITLYRKWVVCGQKPVAGMGTGVDAFGVDPNTEFDVRVPYYFVPRTIGAVQPRLLYCTPLQAEEAGYSASPRQYEFPAIEKYNAAHPSNKILPGRQ